MSQVHTDFSSLGLDPAQHEALSLLSEECGELVQIIGKILRHGFESRHPDTGSANYELLAKEIGDVMASLRIAEVQNLISWGEVIRARDRKLISVQQYLHHAVTHRTDEAKS